MLLLAADREELGDLEGEVLGVGPVVAAARAARYIAQYKPSHVVLLGTAGAYGPEPAIGEAIVSVKFGLSPGIAAMGLGYVPRPPPAVRADQTMVEHLSITRCNVLTVGAITTDSTLAERLREGWEVEHMEAFGVAQACHDAQVPLVAVLGIANRVGPTAHAEWLTNRGAAQAAARDAVQPLLAALGYDTTAPGPRTPADRSPTR